MVSAIALIGSSNMSVAEEECVENQQCEEQKAKDSLDYSIKGDIKFGLRAGKEDARLSEAASDRDHDFFARSEFKLETLFETKDGEWIDFVPAFSHPIKFGTEIEIDVDADLDETNVDEASIFIEKAKFGRVEFGRFDGVEDAFKRDATSIAAGTGGIGGDFENLGVRDITDSSDAAKVSYLTPGEQFLRFGVSYTPDTGDERDQDDNFEHHLGVGALFSIENGGDDKVEFSAVGSFGKSEDDDEDDLSAFALGARQIIGSDNNPALQKYGLDAVRLGASYGNDHAPRDLQFFTLGATFSLDVSRFRFVKHDANVGLGYNFVDDDDTDVKTHFIVLSGDVTLYKSKMRGGHSNS
ncbi:MAG: porin [Pseudomonadota bacterium]